MGRRTKKDKRDAFLKVHPLCCFCGGKTPAVEIDHIPSRALFADRAWPEGYHFPACYRCNHATSFDEEVVAYISRMLPTPAPGAEAEKVASLERSLRAHRPEVLAEMQLTEQEIEEDLKRLKAPPLPPGMTIVRTTGPLVKAAVENFGRKLMLALYYKESGLIVPSTGGAGLFYYSNLQFGVGKLPLTESLDRLMRRFPTIQRNGCDLSSQFNYVFGLAKTREVGAFRVFFRHSFALLGFVLRERERALPRVPDSAILRPYSW